MKKKHIFIIVFSVILILVFSFLAVKKIIINNVKYGKLYSSLNSKEEIKRVTPQILKMENDELRSKINIEYVRENINEYLKEKEEINSSGELDSSEEKEEIIIVDASYLKGDDINVIYPQISGIKDDNLRSRINKLFEDEAFRSYMDKDNFSLHIKYEILYQSEKFISVKYIGFAYLKGAPYPRDIFSTINIDLKTGDKIQLKDIINLDHAFVGKIRETLYLYIQKDPDWEVLYLDQLNNSDEFLLKVLLKADKENSGDCFSYFTDDALGMSFAVSHVAGDHYEIEMKYSDIEEYMVNKNILDLGQ